MPATSENTLAYAPLSNVKRTLESTKAMEYANEARTRTLPKWADDVLLDAAMGREIDVWIFYQALTQAMSAATTRHAHSQGRREHARKIRHLSYWAAAVLEKTLTHMEPVDAPTSPALQAARDQLSSAEGEIHGLKMDLAAALEQNGRYIEQLEKNDETLKAFEVIARLEETRSAALIREKTAMEISVARALDLIDYMSNLLTEAQAAQMIGYIDGREAEGS